MRKFYSVGGGGYESPCVKIADLKMGRRLMNVSNPSFSSVGFETIGNDNTDNGFEW